jgi:ureidoglycolate lyase
MQTIQAQLLTAETYRNYGDVIAARSDIKPVLVNRGTAQRFNFLGQLQNLRGEKANANLCLFRCSPVKESPFQIKLLEHHPFSTQTFIPMIGSKRYLVVVCLGSTEPELNTLQAFLASDSQGITYHPGVWHHPLLALDEVTDFACVVWENGTPEDCTVREIRKEISIQWK